MIVANYASVGDTPTGTLGVDPTINMALSGSAMGRHYDLHK